MSSLCDIFPDDPSCTPPAEDEDYWGWWWLKKQTPSQGSGPNVADFKYFRVVRIVSLFLGEVAAQQFLF